jgi:hypothetical protein
MTRNVYNDFDAASKKYLVHFDMGPMPPVDGFWSITMYDEPSDGCLKWPRERLALGIYVSGQKDGYRVKAVDWKESSAHR